ncbi:F-box/LRR-repeat protein 15 [Bienertia sinuspersici]
MNDLIKEEQTSEVVEKMRALHARMEELQERDEMYRRKRTSQRAECNKITVIKDDVGNHFDDD